MNGSSWITIPVPIPMTAKGIAWDRVDDTVAWCETPGCRYDNGISEEQNRAIAKGENHD